MELEASYINVLENHFPGRYSYTADDNILLLKFEELTVSNTEGGSVVIRDMYVRIIFQTPYKIDSRIKGVMFKPTPRQRSVGYNHSHLPTRSRPSSSLFGRFCQGGGTRSVNPFKYATSAMSTLNSPDSEKFEMWLIQLRAYLQHESIDGGPHIRMANIPSSDYVGVSRLSSNELCNYYLAYYSDKIPITLNNVEYGLPIPQISLSNISEIHRQLSDRSFTNTLAVNNGTMIDYPQPTASERIIFRGQTIQLTIHIEGSNDNAVLQVDQSDAASLTARLNQKLLNVATSKNYKTLWKETMPR